MAFIYKRLCYYCSVPISARTAATPVSLLPILGNLNQQTLRSGQNQKASIFQSSSLAFALTLPTVPTDSLSPSSAAADARSAEPQFFQGEKIKSKPWLSEVFALPTCMRGVFRLLRPIFFAIKHFPQPPSSLPYLRHLLLVLISRLPHLLQFESMLLLGGCGGFFEAVEDFGVVGTGGEGSGGGVQGEVGRQFRGGSGLVGEFEQQVQTVLLVGVELLGKHADCLVIIKDYLPSDLSQNLHSLPTALTASASPAPPRPPLPTLLPWQKLHVISSLQCQKVKKSQILAQSAQIRSDGRLAERLRGERGSRVIIRMLKQQGEDTEDPLQAVSLDAAEEFAFYQKDIPQNYKSRGQKNKERVQRITRKFVDPELKRQTRQQQKQVEKAKLHRIIESMSEEEARKYLDERKARRAEEKGRVRAAMGSGQVFMIDLVFEAKMNEKENKSLTKQIELIMRAIKQFESPPSIHLCSFSGSIRAQMEKMNYHFWAVTSHPEDVKTTAQLLAKNPIYLSPQAELPLQQVEADSAFILGGLIDRTIIKYASYHRANELGIEARHLPIAQFMKGRSCLNLDHVVAMVCKFKETGDWKVAFDYAAPKRWKKEEKTEEKEEKGAEGEKEEKGEQGEEGESEQSVRQQQQKVEIAC